MTSSAWLTHETFAPHVGDRFDVRLVDDRTLTLELVEVTPGSATGGRGPEGQERLQFSLEFRGPATPELPQATYELAHAELGELAIFLVPIGAGPDGVRYEAAFA